MHELSLCRNILELLEQQAQKDGFTKVHLIELELGDLAAIEEEALRFGFEVAKQGTIVENAELRISHLSGQARCDHCGASVNIQSYLESCPACGSYGLEIVGGNQLMIKNIEVE